MPEGLSAGNDASITWVQKTAGIRLHSPQKRIRKGTGRSSDSFLFRRLPGPMASGKDCRNSMRRGRTPLRELTAAGTVADSHGIPF